MYAKAAPEKASNLSNCWPQKTEFWLSFEATYKQMIAPRNDAIIAMKAIKVGAICSLPKKRPIQPRLALFIASRCRLFSLVTSKSSRRALASASSSSGSVVSLFEIDFFAAVRSVSDAILDSKPVFDHWDRYGKQTRELFYAQRIPILVQHKSRNKKMGRKCVCFFFMWLITVIILVAHQNTIRFRFRPIRVKHTMTEFMRYSERLPKWPLFAINEDGVLIAVKKTRDILISQVELNEINAHTKLARNMGRIHRRMNNRKQIVNALYLSLHFSIVGLGHKRRHCSLHAWLVSEQK